MRSPVFEFACRGAAAGLLVLVSIGCRPLLAADAKVILEGHTAYITSLAFTPDGKHLASGALDKTVRLWNVTNRQSLKFETDRGSGFSVAISPDGKLLAAGGFHLTIPLWSVPDGKELAALPGSDESGQTRRVAFSRDGKLLAAAQANGELWIWDAAQRKRLQVVAAHHSGIQALAFSPTSDVLAAGSPQQFFLWDTVRWKVSSELGDRNLEVQSLAYTTDGKTLVSGDKEGAVRVWDPKTGKQRSVVKIFPPGVDALAVSPDGKWAACPGEHWDVALIDVAAGRQVKTIRGFVESVRAVAFSPDGKTLAVGCQVNVYLVPLTLAQSVEKSRAPLKSSCGSAVMLPLDLHYP